MIVGLDPPGTDLRGRTEGYNRVVCSQCDITLRVPCFTVQSGLSVMTEASLLYKTNENKNVLNRGSITFRESCIDY